MSRVRDDGRVSTKAAALMTSVFMLGATQALAQRIAPLANQIVNGLGNARRGIENLAQHFERLRLVDPGYEQVGSASQ